MKGLLRMNVLEFPVYLGDLIGQTPFGDVMSYRDLYRVKAIHLNRNGIQYQLEEVQKNSTKQFEVKISEY